MEGVAGGIARAGPLRKDVSDSATGKRYEPSRNSLFQTFMCEFVWFGVQGAAEPMALGAIHYVKHLKEIQGKLPVSNRKLSTLSGISDNKISKIRSRVASKQSTQSAIQKALEEHCQKERSVPLIDFMASLNLKNVGSLTYDDVFQTADWQAVDLASALAAVGIDAAALELDLRASQIKQVMKGAFFTLYIRQRIEKVFLDHGAQVPEGLFRQGSDDEIKVIVDET